MFVKAYGKGMKLTKKSTNCSKGKGEEKTVRLVERDIPKSGESLSILRGHWKKDVLNWMGHEFNYSYKD